MLRRKESEWYSAHISETIIVSLTKLKEFQRRVMSSKDRIYNLYVLNIVFDRSYNRNRKRGMYLRREASLGMRLPTLSVFNQYSKIPVMSDSRNIYPSQLIFLPMMLSSRQVWLSWKSVNENLLYIFIFKYILRHAAGGERNKYS